MQQSDLVCLRQWFDDYVRSFYSDDRDIQKHVLLKQEHTHKVVENARELAEWLDLSDDQRRLAEAVALFHDIGRFKQYTVYRTFVDHKSVDHARLGLEILAGLPQLACLSDKERAVFTYAIANHNTMKLPAAECPEKQLFATLIRDADKLDIYRVLADTIPAPSTAGYSPVIIRDLLAGRQSSYLEMNTAEDRKLLRLSWVYDINYRWTLEQVVRRQYLEPIIQKLPQTPEVKAVIVRLRQYIEAKLQ